MLNERLRALRESRGINQKEFAKKIYASKQSVSNWENDNIQPSVEVLMRIANYFSVSTDYLLGLDDRKYIEVSNLTEEQVAHIQLIIDDISKK